MSANNHGVFIGRVGKDPETRTVGSGRSVTKFSLAVKRPGKDAKGQEVTDWFSVDVWGKQAELAMQLITKGALISVHGAVQIDEWTDQQGARQKMVKIAGDGFQMLESKAEREAQQGNQQRAPAAQAAKDQAFFDDDDIPPF